MGFRGSGKSTVARAFFHTLAPEKCFVFDPAGQWGDVGALTCYDSEQVADGFLSGHRRIRLLSGSPEDAADCLDMCKEINGMFIVLDEADMLLDASRKLNPHSFNWCLDYGRHAGIGIMCIARRPTDLPRGFTAQSTIVWHTFREPADITWARARLGRVPENLPPFAWKAHTMDGEEFDLPASWAESFAPVTQWEQSQGGDDEHADDSDSGGNWFGGGDRDGHDSESVQEIYDDG